MSRRHLLLLGLAALAACAAEPPSTRFYGDIRYSEESGDLGGMWVELTGVGPATKVFFVSCEGACNGGGTFPATSADGALRFTAVEQWTRSSGEPVTTTTRYIAVPQGRSLIVTSPDVPEMRAVLPERAARDPRIG